MKDMKIKQPKSLTEMVVARLRKAIVDGEIGLGENISEEKLAESFGVSRTPAREALAQLQLQGLVTVQSKRGSFVFTPTIQDVERICEYRKMLETGAARIAVGHNKGALLVSLRRILSSMAQAMEHGDIVAYGQLDTDFHQAFFDHCGNSYVCDAYQLVSGRIAALRTHLTRPAASLREQSFAEHQTFIELLDQENFADFERLVMQHVDRTGEIYVGALGEGTGDEKHTPIFQIIK